MHNPVCHITELENGSWPTKSTFQCSSTKVGTHRRESPTERDDPLFTFVNFSGFLLLLLLPLIAVVCVNSIIRDWKSVLSFLFGILSYIVDSDCRDH